MLKPGITGITGVDEAVLGRRIPPVLIKTAKLIGTCGGIGYIRAAQGTFGALLVPVLYHLLPQEWFAGYPGPATAVLAIMAVVAYFAGVWASGVLEQLWGIDPGRVVIDEFMGICLTLLFVPITPGTVWAGFILFRIFDIVKPPPIHRLELTKGGWGVMNDDLMAAVYAGILLRLGWCFLA
jgi:phosphatidylglycerophosphatase A